MIFGVGKRPVATVNGIKVYSDKRLTSIVNTKVHFHDGSWCDVATGEVVNRGNGYISFKGSMESERSEQKKIGPTSYPVRPVVISDLPFGIKIETHDKEEILLTLDGDEGEVDSIKVTEGTTLNIQGQDRGSSGSNVTVSNISVVTSVSSISIGSNIVCGSANQGGYGAMLLVPKGITISIEEIEGPITLGDTEGDLELRLRGSCDATIGKVKNLSIKARGSSDARIAQVNGDLSIATSGSSDIDVKGGAINRLEIEKSGSGDIDIRAIAQSGRIRTSGSGDVFVTRIEEEPTVRQSGSGEVNVGNWR